MDERKKLGPFWRGQCRGFVLLNMKAYKAKIINVGLRKRIKKGL